MSRISTYSLIVGFESIKVICLFKIWWQNNEKRKMFNRIENGLRLCVFASNINVGKLNLNSFRWKSVWVFFFMLNQTLIAWLWSNNWTRKHVSHTIFLLTNLRFLTCQKIERKKNLSFLLLMINYKMNYLGVSV